MSNPMKAQEVIKRFSLLLLFSKSALKLLVQFENIFQDPTLSKPFIALSTSLKNSMFVKRYHLTRDCFDVFE